MNRDERNTYDNILRIAELRRIRRDRTAQELARKSDEVRQSAHRLEVAENSRSEAFQSEAAAKMAFTLLRPVGVMDLVRASEAVEDAATHRIECENQVVTMDHQKNLLVAEQTSVKKALRAKQRMIDSWNSLCDVLAGERRESALRKEESEDSVLRSPSAGEVFK
ncbi:MAG: hypothetical protein ACRCWF_05985 [Beijerinckiaceae bacterium]